MPEKITQTTITLEEALTGLQNLPLPEITEGDIIWYPGGALEEDKGHRFKYENGEWISYPVE